VWSDPKSHKSRVVSLSPGIARMMEAYLDTYVGPEPDALVFKSPTGCLLDPNNFRNDIFQPALEAAGLSGSWRPHDLRHTCASLLAKSGKPLHYIKEHLGHASIVTTEKYQHFYEEDRADITAGMDSLLGRDNLGILLWRPLGSSDPLVL
jgi:integrase